MEDIALEDPASYRLYLKYNKEHSMVFDSFSIESAPFCVRRDVNE